MICPCSSNKVYKNCCQKAHLNIETVLTAEALMRSRYSAFVLADIAYLHKSHHSSTRLSKKEYKELETWTKLEILNSTENTVYFKDYFIENGTLEVIKEHSVFCKEHNYWVYLEAE